MNEDKMELEEAIKTLKIVVNKSDQPFKFAIETVLQTLEKLQKHCKEMTKEKQELSSALLDSIPKKKIEDKIEELKKEGFEYENSVCTMYYKKQDEIDTLQELLEDK